jgi:hypothetical protein
MDYVALAKSIILYIVGMALAAAIIIAVNVMWGALIGYAAFHLFGIDKPLYLWTIVSFLISGIGAGIVKNARG